MANLTSLDINDISDYSCLAIHSPLPHCPNAPEPQIGWYLDMNNIFLYNERRLISMWTSTASRLWWTLVIRPFSPSYCILQLRDDSIWKSAYSLKCSDEQYLKMERSFRSVKQTVYSCMIHFSFFFSLVAKCDFIMSKNIYNYHCSFL